MQKKAHWLAFLLFMTCLQLSAHSQDQIITFQGKKVPMEKVFAAIKKQTGYSIFYKQDEVADASPITIDVHSMPLTEFLQTILKDKGFSFEVTKTSIVIMKKATPKPQTSSGGVAAPVTGKVTGPEGQPLQGVNIAVKGTRKGTVTDAEGKFSIEASEGQTLEISSIGFESRSIVVTSVHTYTIGMTVAASKLDEVKIIAYGTTTERLAVGNVSTVTSKDIEKQPVTNPLLALAGRVPGLFITQNSSLPGGGITVRIQGQNSIASGNDPLYVVDGVPVNSQLPATGSGQGLAMGNSGLAPSLPVTPAGNPLSYINPSDIESIDVLKDADATAIYGSRAANGAILITTKKGVAGKNKVTVNLEQGVGKVARKLHMMNRRQYLDMRYEALRNDGVTTIPDNQFDLKLWDTTRSTDWQKTLIGNTAHYTNAGLTISGGTSTVQYLVGATYRRQSTVFPLPSDFADQVGNVHFSLNTSSVNQRLRMQLTGSYMADHNKLPSGDMTQLAVQLEPVAPALFNGDGTLNWAYNAAGGPTFIYNPMVFMYQYYKNRTNNLISNLTLSYKLLPGLELKSSMGYNTMETEDFTPIPEFSIRPDWRGTVVQRGANFGSRNISSWIIEPQLQYKTSIGEGRLETLVGGTLMNNRTQGGVLYGSGYASDALLSNPMAGTFLQQTAFYLMQYKYNALFGRVSYNWQEKYLLNVTARRDGSSKFGSANLFHNFTSIGGAWVFSKEDPVADLLPFLSFGKLRASYGTTGNDQIADYQYLSLYNNLYIAGVPYQGATAMQPNGLSNPYLQWEETRKLQVGLNLGFLKDRILFNAAYNRNRSSNQLLSYNLPGFTGFQFIVRNFPALIQNVSWEFSLNTTQVKGDKWSWSTNLNLTIPRNKVLSFPNLSESSYASALFIGEPLGANRTYHFLGVDPATGEYQFADSKGNATAMPQYPDDYTVIVNTAPKLYGGLENSISFGNWRLDVLFQFVRQDGLLVRFNNRGNPAPGVFLRNQSNQPVNVLRRWQKPGDITDIQAFHSDPSYNDKLFNAFGSDGGVGDASYARLKNLSLSWQLPARWQQKVHCSDASLYVHVQNLLTITGYKGLDPENQSTYSLPPLRIWTVGIRAAF